MWLDGASSSVVFANSLEFAFNVGKIIISICRSFVFEVGGALQVIFTAMILLCVNVRSKSNMCGSLIEVNCFYLVAVVGHIIFEVVTALVVLVIVAGYLVLLELPHKPSLPLIIKSWSGLHENNVAALAASGIVVGIWSFRAVDAFPVFGIRAFGRAFNLAQMILLLAHAIIPPQLPLMFTGHGAFPARCLHSRFVTTVIIALVNISREPSVLSSPYAVLLIEFSVVWLDITCTELGRVNGITSDSPRVAGLFGVLRSLWYPRSRRRMHDPLFLFCILFAKSWLFGLYLFVVVLDEIVKVSFFLGVVERIGLRLCTTSDLLDLLLRSGLLCSLRL